MKLEALPIAEISVGMVQIQNQLANLTLQLQDIKKGKEVREEVWCTKCRIEGHSREHCPVFAEYLAIGAPNPLPQAQVLGARYVEQMVIDHKISLCYKNMFRLLKIYFAHFVSLQDMMTIIAELMN